MDRIQDKAVTFLNDMRKKKIGVGSKAERNDCKKDPVKNVFIHNSDILSNNCYYCQKIFLSPKFLLKHILRRHPDNLIQLHRNCFKTESNNNSIDSHNLLKFLQDEFSKLREELIVLQSDRLGVPKDKSDVSEELQQHASSTSRDHKGSDWQNTNDPESDELQIVKGKVLDLENNIQCLYNKFEQLNTIVTDKVLSEQDVHNLIISNENKIIEAHEAQFLELRSTFHDKLHNLVSNQQHQNSIELQSQFSELKEEIARLDHLIDLTRKQINSPDHLRDLEKRFNDKIVHFIGRGDRSKRMVSETRFSKLRNKSNIPSRRSFLKNKETPQKKSESGIETVPIAESIAENSVPHSPKLYTFELSCMLSEKLSSLGIDPNTSKISCDEYKAKMKLIEFEKKQLLKKNSHFLKYYDKINMLADDRVNYTLQQKKSRKIRFSEPLISNKNNHKSRSKIQNKTYPNVENDSFTFSEPNENVYLKSNQENIQNRIYSSVNSHKFSVSDIGKSDKCFGNFLKTHKLNNKFQSTPIKEFASIGVVHNVDSQVVDIKNLNTDCSVNPEHFVSEVKNSLIQDFESSSSSLEDVPSKDIVTGPSKNFSEEKFVSDDISCDSLSDWESDNDNF